MIGVYMCNTYKQLSIFSCVTHSMDNSFALCNTYVGLCIFQVLHIYIYKSGYSY